MYVIMKTKRKLIPKSNAVSNTSCSFEENVAFDTSRSNEKSVVVRDLCHNVDDVGTSVVSKRQLNRFNSYFLFCKMVFGEGKQKDNDAVTTISPRSDPISSLSPTIRSNQRSDPHTQSSSPRRCHRRRPSLSETKKKRRNINMAMISAFTTVDKMATVDKTAHNSRTTSRDLWLSLEKAYAPHPTSREYTLKTQLLRIEMHGDETPDAYLNQYNGLKTTIAARQIPTAFSELHALFSDHDYMLGKTRAPALSITSSFAVNYAVGSPSMLEARQAQLSELTAQLSALGFQVSLIAPSGPQAFYGVRLSNRNYNNNNHTGANSHVTPDLEAMDNSEAYYGDDALHVGNGKGLPILHIAQKSDVCSTFKSFVQMVERQFTTELRNVQTDWG
nr:nucleotide-binding, alpha-beta plait [Tanacetum cinerariifolium]